METKKMKITWHGHSCFLVEAEEYRIVLDPFEEVPGYRTPDLTAEEALPSHGHSDHNHLLAVKVPLMLKHSPFTVKKEACWHDPEQGALRGPNTIHILEACGLRAVHLGDLGEDLSEERIRALGPCDVLMTPVGGFYTIDGVQAARLVKILQPRVVIPMHYRGEGFGFDNIDTVEPFLAHFPAESVRRQTTDTLELTAQTPGGVAVLTFGV